MKHTHNTLFFALLFLTIIGSAFLGQKVYADGGQVTTNGIIGFYEEQSREPIETSSSEPPKIAKPKGRLPSTGEIVSNPFVWIGALLVVGTMFFLKRSKKQRQIKEDNQ